MSKLTILKMSRKYRPDALPSLFCNSTSYFYEYLLKGVLVIEENIGEFRIGDKLVVIDNIDNLSKEEILSNFNIAHINDIKMEVISEHCINYGEFIPFNAYKKDYFDSLKKINRKNIIKNKIKKDIESNKKILTSEEINKIYNELNLPKADDINKIDFLEYSLYFDNSIKRYKLFCELKHKDMSWKEFKNLEFKDFNYN